MEKKFEHSDDAPSSGKIIFCSVKLPIGQEISVSRIRKDTWRIGISSRFPDRCSSGTAALRKHFRSMFAVAYGECLQRLTGEVPWIVPGSYFEGLAMLFILRDAKKRGSSALYLPVPDSANESFRPHEVYCSLKAIERILLNAPKEFTDEEKEIIVHYRNIWRKYADMPEVSHERFWRSEYALTDILCQLLPRLRTDRQLAERFTALTGLEGEKISHSPVREWPRFLSGEPNPLTEGMLCRLLCRTGGAFPRAEEQMGTLLRQTARQYCQDAASWFFSKSDEAGPIMKDNTRAVKITVRQLKYLTEPEKLPMNRNVHIPE